MKLAAIDIGTNSTRLLISDYRRHKFFTLERKMEITRLGKDLDRNNIISDDSAGRTFKVLSSYRDLIEKYKVKKYRAVGTNALRKASNSGRFISSAKEFLGINIDVISGEEEAGLSFYGAVKGMDSNSQGGKIRPASRILVIDIGGGSCEFILGEYGCCPEFTGSVDVGSVSLTERFIDSGIPNVKSLNKMRRYIKEKLESTIKEIKKFGSISVTGVAGTITTLTAIDLNLEVYDSERIHGHILSLKRIEEIYDFLCGMNLMDRKKVVGLNPKRADIIIGGTAIAIEILKMLNCKFIRVSEKDILNGIIYTLIDF